MSYAAIRRILHAGSSAVLVLAHIGSVELLRYTLAAGVGIALLLELLRLARPAFGAVIGRLVPVFRVSEARSLSGATWLCIGYAVAAWFPTTAATAGILVGAFADPAASLAGSVVSEKGARKTWFGSGTALVVSALVLQLTGLPVGAVLCGAFAAMVLERWPGPFNDNITVPIGVAAVTWSWL